ncbi:MAG: hypothetical protein HKN27_15615 [Silicimonas sp.]|nr:hypothetical protein [Silicimonas sp.]
MKKYDHKSLEQLEKDIWPAPDYPSYLVTTCHELRKKKLSDFTAEDLRIMIGQSIGLRYLLPKAIEFLQEDPFCQGDFYQGDLLMALTRLPAGQLPVDKCFKYDLIEILLAALSSDAPKLSKADRTTVNQLLERISTH